MFPFPTNEPFVWLILSTNDCWPGCGCDKDVFKITSFRVYRWIKRVGIGQAEVALEQLENLTQFTEKDFEVLSGSISIYCGSDPSVYGEFLDLVCQSRETLEACLNRLKKNS